VDLLLQHKRAVVTGASRGIGFAVADALAAEGVDVALAARHRDNLDAAADRVARHGHKAVAIVTDTTSDESVRSLIEGTVASLGGVDILVNCAALPASPAQARLLRDIEDNDLRVEMETKVLGYLRCARAAAPHMTAQGWGRIINIGGLAARQTGLTVGSIRNVAVASLTKSLADELGPFGVNVTVVHPGMTVTERTPALLASMGEARGVTADQAEQTIAAGISIRRIVTAAEVADVVAFLASPRSVGITGDPIAVAGGVPGPIYY
jgi:NAD(P)-dependent dehydrogenase (short-subunit alcohol dehydrogenase family)